MPKMKTAMSTFVKSQEAQPIAKTVMNAKNEDAPRPEDLTHHGNEFSLIDDIYQNSSPAEVVENIFNATIILSLGAAATRLFVGVFGGQY